MKINGESVELDAPVPLIEFLGSSGFDPERTAVELNGRVVPKKDYVLVRLNNEDSVEIVSFVGGG